ncbi:MAG: FAD:protein FMN transferase [Deltaproteobacteria bacterium]|nr:FAD:protein FMN transferase [Deltaproteobacteria bacterium]
MGTSYQVKLAGNNLPHKTQPIKKEIDLRLERINQLMSTYFPDSELNRLNRTDSKWFPVSKETYFVIGNAQRISRDSGGAFDITVGALVNLWGFGNKIRADQIPDEKAISTLKNKLGYDKIMLNPDELLIGKKHPEITLDLSAIAKGYAVDSVAALLEKRGILDYMVEIGGEIKARGYKAENHPWVLAIEKPILESREVQRLVSLNDQGMATSGDYRNYFEKDGVRYSHSINPNTARPITHKLASVSVINPSTMIADGWATALMVLGPEKGYEIALREKLAAYFIYREKDGFVEKYTPDFEKYFIETKTRL